MTRTGYLRYLLARLAECLLVATLAAALALFLERSGALVPPPLSAMAAKVFGPRARPIAGCLNSLAGWIWPALWAVVAHVVLGPKQRRPIYRKIPGAMYSYAGIAVDRNAGCRGGYATGSTGCGKTLACILPRLHSLCVNEGGSADPPRAPWGGLICGEKGNEWQTVAPLLAHYGRERDLCLLQTRPADAPAGWTPPARFNLLSMGDVPADSYAKLIVDTGLAIEEADRPDAFFVPQARDKIAWGLRLLRAVAAAGPPPPARPDFVTLFNLLTVQESYVRFLTDVGAETAPLALSPGLNEARFQLEHNYWNQPPDQLGGVRSTIYNFLAPFTEPEIAEVFGAENTFDLRDIERGRVVCLALPQRHALQRRYVTTLLKTLVYQIILNRFDLRRDSPEWRRRNVLLIEQDEWQRYAVRADCEVDVVREAQGATYAASQSQNAVWLKYGGRDKASPLIANLRNRWIGQAATDECAEESSRLISERVARELSYSRHEGGRTVSVSFADRPFVPKSHLRLLPPFHVYFVPAEGPWLFKQCIAMPVTPDGHIPPWWFGNWNPLRAAAHYLRLPETVAGCRLHSRADYVPPWRARAPLRAQWRRLCGLDGTFITLEAVSLRQALRRARRP